MEKQDFITLLGHALNSSVNSDKIPLELLAPLLLQSINNVQQALGEPLTNRLSDFSPNTPMKLFTQEEIANAHVNWSRGCGDIPCPPQPEHDVDPACEREHGAPTSYIPFTEEEIAHMKTFGIPQALAFTGNPAAGSYIQYSLFVPEQNVMGGGFFSQEQGLYDTGCVGPALAFPSDHPVV